MTRFIFSFLALLCLITTAAQAEESSKEAVPPEKKTPITEWIAAENALIEPLTDEQQRTFYIIRNKHGVIRSVRVVDRDVGNAVKACGKENPDMKDKMDDRFKAWEGSVLPILDSAEKFLKEEIDKQEMVPASDFRHILKMNDEAFEFSEKQIEKSPVTTKDACEGLLKSMDRTEDKLINLLLDILIPENVIRQRGERQEQQQKDAE